MGKGPLCIFSQRIQGNMMYYVMLENHWMGHTYGLVVNNPLHSRVLDLKLAHTTAPTKHQHLGNYSGHNTRIISKTHPYLGSRGNLMNHGSVSSQKKKIFPCDEAGVDTRHYSIL